MTAPLQYGTPQPSDPTAVMGRRTLAWIADLLLYTAVVAAGAASMVEYVDIPPDIATEDACLELERQTGDQPNGCFALEDRLYLLDESESAVQTGLSLGWFALFVTVQGLTGGSPGKLLFGLRVVDQYGAKAGMGKSLARTLMWVVDAAPWIIPLVGPITAFTSTGHRRVGDLAAGTYVVASSAVGQPVMPAGAPIPAGQTAWGAAPPTSPPATRQGWPGPAASPPPAAPPTDEGTDASRQQSPAPPAAPFAAPGADGPPAAPPVPPQHQLPPPQWDPARGTYLQWDPNEQAWLQWDATAERWKPIDT